VHRAGITAERKNGPLGQGGELEQVGPANNVPGPGFHLEDLRPDIAFGLGADDDGGNPRISDPAGDFGETIDRPPNLRIENIAITGTPSGGSYQFFVDSFGTPNTSDNFTLHVSGGGTNQTITGNLPAGQNSQTVTVHFPGGG
jgi:hypothetical protein